MPLLELKNVFKAFGGLMAVNDVSFKVEKGEILGLIGPNGSGKTTTFNCICQFFPITSGDIVFNGKSIKGLKTHQICQAGIGRTFQVVKPLARMTVRDNVTASAFCRVNSIREAQYEADKILEWLKREINQAWEKRADITPSTEGAPRPLVLEILKLLPRTNCRQCGEPTCMVFAARAAEGVKSATDCPPLTAEAQNRLRDYLGRFNFDV